MKYRSTVKEMMAGFLPVHSSTKLQAQVLAREHAGLGDAELQEVQKETEEGIYATYNGMDRDLRGHFNKDRLLRESQLEGAQCGRENNTRKDSIHDLKEGKRINDTLLSRLARTYPWEYWKWLIILEAILVLCDMMFLTSAAELLTGGSLLTSMFLALGISLGILIWAKGSSYIIRLGETSLQRWLLRIAVFIAIIMVLSGLAAWREDHIAEVYGPDAADKFSAWQLVTINAFLWFCLIVLHYCHPNRKQLIERSERRNLEQAIRRNKERMDDLEKAISHSEAQLVLNDQWRMEQVSQVEGASAMIGHWCEETIHAYRAEVITMRPSNRLIHVEYQEKHTLA